MGALYCDPSRGGRRSGGSRRQRRRRSSRTLQQSQELSFYIDFEVDQSNRDVNLYVLRDIKDKATGQAVTDLSQEDIAGLTADVLGLPQPGITFW